jgi:hypothetical protein
MIVKYIWHTDRYNHRLRERRERTWKGLFLFGFIPLYIENTHLTIK